MKLLVLIMSGTAEAGTRDEHDIVDGFSRNLFIAIIQRQPYKHKFKFIVYIITNTILHISHNNPV